MRVNSSTDKSTNTQLGNAQPTLVLANGEPCFHHQGPPPYLVRDLKTDIYYMWDDTCNGWRTVNMNSQSDLDAALEAIGRGNKEEAKAIHHSLRSIPK